MATLRSLRAPIKINSARAIRGGLFNCSALQRKLKTLFCSLTGKQLVYSLWTKLLMDNGSCHVNIEWDPEGIINAQTRNIQNCFACIVLNRKIRIPVDIVQKIWQNATLRCTVDGGTNRWKNFLLEHSLECQMELPDYITGDFDSITEETSKYFTNAITKRVPTPDQDATDFTKSIDVIRPLLEEHEKIPKKFIIVFHDTSGRLDHIIANLDTLYKVKSDNFNVYLLSGQSMTWLLLPGKHSIKIPKDLVEKERWCALMPIGCKATSVTTRGLKWNLVNGEMEFGGLVSTSNTYAAERVDIETDTCLVWSMGLFNFDDDYD